MVKVFQGGRGKFTVALQLENKQVKATFALCGEKDAFVRRVGFHRVTGLLKARAGNKNVLIMGDYLSDDFHKDIVQLMFERLDGVNTQDFAQSSDRVDYLLEVICFAFKDAVDSLQVVAVAN